MSQTRRTTNPLSPSMSVLFLLLLMKPLMKPSYAKSLACIASVVQQLLQTPLVLLIDIYFEIMRTLVALAIMTILYTLYTVTCVEIKLQWSFFILIIDTLSKKI